MRTEAFLFDMDGTLVDTEAAWTRAIVDLVNARGGRTSFEEVLPGVIGRNWYDIHRALHERHPEIGDTSPEEDASELRAGYARYAADPGAIVIPGAVSFFRKAAKIAPCAIVSGSPHDDVVRTAEMCGIADDLALVLGAGEYERGKPDPSGYLRAAGLLGADPKRCVVIEDSTVGVASGVAAGMRVVAVDRPACPGARQSFAGQTWLVKDLSELDMEVFL